MPWMDTYPLSDQNLHLTRLNTPPQLPETRGKWNLGKIPEYFRGETIRCIAIQSPTLNYFKNIHQKNWHTGVERWPKAFRVLTDYGEGIYHIKDPRLNLHDLPNQTNRYEYYDAFGNRTTPPSEFDLEQARWRSVAWYPAFIAFRLEFPQFDRVLVGTDAYEDHINRVVEEEIRAKSQAMNIRLWDGGLRAYVLDYDPTFSPINSTTMAWGSIPYYINSIAWKRVTNANNEVILTPITQQDIAQVDAILKSTTISAANWTTIQNLFNSFSFFYTNSDGETVTATSPNMRQQTVATVNRGVADFPASVPTGFPTDYHQRKAYLRRELVKNLWWSVPSELSIYLRGSERVEMPQIIYPIGTDSSGNPIYPRYNLSTQSFEANAGNFPFTPADLERLYYATFVNYGANRPKAGFCRPEVLIRMNQLAMTQRIFEQSRRSFGPADFGIDAIYRDVAMLSELAVPPGVLYLLGAEDIHFAFLEDVDNFVVTQRPTMNFIDAFDAWTVYKLMTSDMRRHGIYWGFQV